MATKEKTEKKKIFRNYRGMSHMNQAVSIDDVCPSPPVRTVQKDGLMAEIFAPDMHTGMPRADLALMLGSSIDPATQEYIRRMYMTPVPDSGVGHPDPDVVLETARKTGERLDQYVARLSEYVENGYLKE